MSTTEEELSTLNEFRERVCSIYPECDGVLLNWLRARDLNVDKAEQMLKRHLLWRRNNEIDSLRNWKSPKCFFPYIHPGFDLSGVPIVILPMGRWDFRGVVESGDLVPSLKYIFQCLETLWSAGIEYGVYQGIFICDFDGLSYRQFAHRTVVQGMVEVIRIFESNYPESLKSAYVINAPKVFYILFNLIKPLMESKTLAKVKIFGPDREKWQTELFKTIARDQMPPYWGGALEGGDEYCSKLWNLEPLPPYFTRKLSSTIDEYGEEWFTVKVEPGEKYTLNFEVEVGQERTLKWSFKTDGYDIGFSVCYKEENNNCLIPTRRVDSHLKCVDGFLKLVNAGKYAMVFDNSYSRSRAKMLHCSCSCR